MTAPAEALTRMDELHVGAIVVKRDPNGRFWNVVDYRREPVAIQKISTGKLLPPDPSYGALRPGWPGSCGPFLIGEPSGPYGCSARCTQCSRRGWMPKEWGAAQ